MKTKSDVLIIGSGFGGSVSASRLVDSGLSVTMLERGPWRDTATVRDMGIGERSRLPYGWAFYTRFLRSLQFGQLGDVTLSHKGLWEVYLNRGISVACSSGVGGGSHVYTGLNEKPRMPGFWDGHHEELSDESMAPHYRRVIEEMGGQPLTDQHSLPSHPSEVWKDSPVIDGDRALNAARHAVPFPEDGKVIDRTDGGLLGARNGSKHTVDAVYLRDALNKGLQIKPLTEVRAIYQLDAQQAARYRVEVFDYIHQRMRSYYADRVVLAAGTLNTLRLLFRSRDSHAGLSGMPSLGQNFGTNSDSIALWNVDRSDQDFLHGLPCHGEIGLQQPVQSTTEGFDEPYLLQVGMVGAQHCKLPPFVVRYLRKNLFLVGFSADLANGTARWQRGHLRIEYQKKRNPSYAVLHETYAQIAKRCNTPLYSLPFNLTVHPLGGSAPGSNASEGVVDHRGEVHGHPGLYVADGAAMPGSPGVPPSMSIAAWASQLSEHIVQAT